MKLNNLLKISIVPLLVPILVGCKKEADDGKVQLTFQNYDGTIISTNRVNKGSEAKYVGKVPEMPILGNELANIFIGWDKELGQLTRDTIYTAEFKTINKYVDNDHDGIPNSIDTDDNNNYFEVGAKSYVYLDQNIRIDFSKFLKDGANNSYDNDIAKLGLFLSNPKIDFHDGLFLDKAYGGRVNALYSRLGCDKFEEFSFKENDYAYDTHDATSGVIAHKYLFDDNGNIAKDLIIISFDGTVGKSCWYSNFDIGYDDGSSTDYYAKEGDASKHPDWDKKIYHKGFYVAANRVIKDEVEGKPGPVRFLKYIEDNSKYSNGKPVVFITGHSRGGAIASIIGAYLENEYKNELHKDCIPFVYTFASPCVVEENAVPTTEHVFNIINKDDIVTMVPHTAWGFQRIGNDVVSESVFEKYKEDYNQNKDKREYKIINDGFELFKQVGAKRQDIYNIDTSKEENLSNIEIKTYDTLADAEADLNNVETEIKALFGADHIFNKYYKLKAIEKTTLLGDTYGAIQAYNCFGTIAKLIQLIIISDIKALANIATIIQIISNSKYTSFVASIVFNILAGGTDTVALPHDYGSYHVILKKYR